MISNKFIPVDKIDTRRYQRYFVDLRTLYEKRNVVVYTGLTLSLFAIAFFGIFALRPTLITIAGLTQEIKSRQETEEKLQAKINSLRQAQINYSQVANSIYLVNQALSSDPAISEIVYQIEGLAQKNNLKIDSINFSPVDLIGKNPKIKTTAQTYAPAVQAGFELTLKGNFEEIKSFLQSLEKLRRIIIVDSLTLKKTQTMEITTMSLNLKGQAFYYGEK